jgi:hypothetical protein
LKIQNKIKKIQIKNVNQSEYFECNDFTFDKCSTIATTSNDNFNFMFHSIDQTKIEKSQKHQV